jgi:hypothetical protein
VAQERRDAARPTATASRSTNSRKGIHHNEENDHATAQVCEDSDSPRTTRSENPSQSQEYSQCFEIGEVGTHISMNATMSHRTAIERIRQKVSYLEIRIANPTTPERTRHFAELDKVAFEMGLDALEYVQAVREYEATKELRNKNGTI